MITSFDKAIVAVLGLLVYIMNTYFGMNFGMEEETLNAIAAGLTPLLVWLVPNKETAKAE